MKQLKQILQTSQSPIRLNHKFKSEESIKHSIAKGFLLLWLQQKEAKLCGDLFPFHWRTPSYGVQAELPIFDTSSPYYFENSKGLKCPGKVGDFQKCFDTSKKLGEILFVPDITIFNKGAVRYFIEVVHTNPVSEEKLEKIKFWARLKGASFEVHEVSAEWIMRQSKNRTPKSIKTKLIFHC